MKFERPPFGMELNSVARHTSQIRMSLKLSKIWPGLMWAFCVPLEVLAAFLTFGLQRTSSGKHGVGIRSLLVCLPLVGFDSQ